jgi:hypothetical protein
MIKMPNCKQVARLLSQSMEARLPWHQRLGVRFHLLYCVWCRRYASQIQFLSKATKGLATGEEDSSPAQKLSPEAKEQMRQRVQNALNHPPSH